MTLQPSVERTPLATFELQAYVYSWRQHSTRQQNFRLRGRFPMQSNISNQGGWALWYQLLANANCSGVTLQCQLVDSFAICLLHLVHQLIELIPIHQFSVHDLPAILYITFSTPSALCHALDAYSATHSAV